MGEAKDSGGRHSFLKEFCIPFLLGAQNSDGGWGFHGQSESRVESTCWALRALENASIPVSMECLHGAREYLLKEQLADGSWPAAPHERTGGWVTSLVCGLWSQQSECEDSVRAGLNWLCKDLPRDSRLWRRLLRRLVLSPDVSEHDESLHGWGWTPGTSSWVEPTSFALMALRDCPPPWLPPGSSLRCELGVRLLYDRICPQGGWNCGNPRVYGVEGEPLVLPTAWALLALRNLPSHEKKSKSLIWLRNTFGGIQGSASLAIAGIALGAYGVPIPELDIHLEKLLDVRDFLRTTETVSWVCLALSPKRCWFPVSEGTA